MSEEFQSLYPATLTSLTSLVQPSWTGPLSYWRCYERLLWCYVSIMVYCAFTTMVPTWHVLCSCFQDNSEDFRLAQPNVASHLPLRAKLVGTIFGVHVGSAFFSSKRCVTLTSCKVNNFQVGWARLLRYCGEVEPPLCRWFVPRNSGKNHSSLHRSWSHRTVCQDTVPRDDLKTAWSKKCATPP